MKVTERGVSFQVGAAVEAEIRLNGKHLGEKTLNDLVVAVRSNYHADWKESDEAKKLAKQMLNEVQELIDEGSTINVTDYIGAAKIYAVWVERCSETLGTLDVQMRQFAQNQTNYKRDFDQVSLRIYVSNRTPDDSDKTCLKYGINMSLEQLRRIWSTVKTQTTPKKLLDEVFDRS